MRCLILTLLCLPCLLVSAELITIANGEWAPYQSDKLENKGVISDIVEQAFALQGISVKYQFYPWKRNFDLAKNGVLDGSIMWAKRNEREVYFVYSDTIIISENVYFHLKSFEPDITNPEKAIKTRLGLMAGWGLGKDIQFASVEYVVNEEQNISKLLRNRIDIFLTDRRVGYHLLNKHFLAKDIEQITYDKKIIYIEPYFLVLNRKLHENSGVMERFNIGLQELKSSGTYDRLMAKIENKNTSN